MKLLVAVGEHERSRLLPEVEIPGIELEVVSTSDDGARHDRFLSGQYDACELSMALYVGFKSRGRNWTAIPVFPNRRFRHSFVYINTASGIREPRDLHGKRVGISSWFNTAATWMRGNLEDGYGVELNAVRWVTSRGAEVGDWTPPEGFSVELAPRGHDLVAMLVQGELNAIVVPSLIRPFREKDPRVARLFPDYVAAEEEYYRRTGVFPISHSIVINRDRVGENAELPEKLWRAFVEAKRRSFEYTKRPGHANLIWYGAWSEREREFFGDVDPWDYSIRGNRPTLEAFLGYARRQGMLRDDLTVEDLFHPSAVSFREH